MYHHLNREHPEYELIKGQLIDIGKDMRARLLGKGLPAHESLIQMRIHDALEGESNHFQVVTLGPCLVGYNVYTPWWSLRRMLVEDFIYRYKPGPFSDTLNGVEEHAKDLGCAYVCIGTLAMIREDAYVALLSRKGYRSVAQQLIKEL